MNEKATDSEKERAYLMRCFINKSLFKLRLGIGMREQVGMRYQVGMREKVEIQEMDQDQV